MALAKERLLFQRPLPALAPPPLRSVIEVVFQVCEDHIERLNYFSDVLPRWPWRIPIDERSSRSVENKTFVLLVRDEEI